MIKWIDSSASFTSITHVSNGPFHRWHLVFSKLLKSFMYWTFDYLLSIVKYQVLDIHLLVNSGGAGFGVYCR